MFLGYMSRIEEEAIDVNKKFYKQRNIYNNPEVGLHEFNSSKKIVEMLKEDGFEVK